ncbi:MAG: hypothetical protein GTO62_07860 [Planctomycetales bacterium]|nr:hypothetical protein [Planctomycetales bacterium]
MLRQLALSIGLLAASFLTSQSAQAEDYSTVAQVEFLTGWTTKSGTQMAGLSITLEPGWKTYWRKPGEAGIPPVFNWGGSQNLQSVAMHWPTPTVFRQNEYHSVGYSERLILPIELSPSQASAPIVVQGTLQLGVCREVCVPVTLNIDQEGAEVGTAAIQQALANAPISRQKAGVGKVTCEITPISDGLRMTVRMKSPHLGGNEHMVVELPDPTIWISEAATHREGGYLIASVDMVPEYAAPFSLDRSDVRVTLLGSKVAVDIQGCSGG